MGEDVQLVGLYWTISGPVEVHVGREWSLFDWADRCAEARKVAGAIATAPAGPQTAAATPTPPVTKN